MQSNSSSGNDIEVLANRIKSLQTTQKVNFNVLPAEVREKIWLFARPDPREIQLHCRECLENPTGNPCHTLKDKAVTTHVVSSHAPVPNMLHVNRESRHLALKWYRLSFNGERGPGTVCFDWEEDKLLSMEECRCKWIDHGSENLAYHLLTVDECRQLGKLTEFRGSQSWVSDFWN
ncbi:hypothetical protein BJ875DRAFT_442951 [Amylocarpus encephaloides]|uniref:2EXR domain-containing protein n=1 Tax=Amylocarpus encephaloides TaxID=45428 RepID=A0A9P7YGL3_9HELO|nr:hypothetical protein BJ875DRAFT_442951 [Amylocarpus encephaloides]